MVAYELLKDAVTAHWTDALSDAVYKSNHGSPRFKAQPTNPRKISHSTATVKNNVLRGSIAWLKKMSTIDDTDPENRVYRGELRMHVKAN